jgi:protein-tyrosine phosphatase
MQLPTKLYGYLLSALLISQWSCTSLESLDAVYPVNPIAAETPVYRDKDEQIIINLARLPDTLALPITVYHGTSYETIDRTRPIGISDDYSFRWEGSEDQQHFFELKSASGATVVVAERLIHFRGTDNTRDLGGYQTRDGRTVRWGKLYRSGDLSGLKKSDFDYFRRVGIRQVIDFRVPEDLERKPDHLPTTDSLITRQFSMYGNDLNRKENRKLLQRSDPDDFNSEEILLDYNRRYVTQHTDEFAQTFEELLQPEQPLLYHCSAGKDRTGLMSALLLLVLDVPRETVMRDFMASNYYRRKTIRFKARFSPLIGINQRIALPLLEVRPIYLEEAFRTIEEKYGSLDNYFRDGLGLSEQEQMELREKYLE